MQTRESRGSAHTRARTPIRLPPWRQGCPRAWCTVGTMCLTGIAGSIAYNWSRPGMKTSVKLIHASVAPMMDWTDNHYRTLARLISRHAWLYIEMVVAETIVHQKDKLGLLLVC
ncbi:uncharacterized protein LOC119272335 isoform X2 [Triticum dicoccoides]|uniref:uncharacterized protein LOC119272335 isoform X2 n=1 Tax=Triticum dicoccoides TaxID=85692 RepID=UPI00188E4283|nr:uncharacterized protein LOC119272335 isoform X2 [Triticum dicoccoides]